MNSFHKLLGKHKNKPNGNTKNSSNPPNKNIINSKPLLVPISKKIPKRNFGKEIQNLRHLTEDNHYFINIKKRKREKPKISSKFTKNDNHKNNKNITARIKQNIKKDSNKIFKVIHLSHNKINQNNYNCISCIEEEEEYQNENTNPNINEDIKISPLKINTCSINENKQEIANEQIINNIKESINNNCKEIKVIKKNVYSGHNDKNEKEEESNKEAKIIKVSIIGNKYGSPKKNSLYINKRLYLQNAKEYLDEIYHHLKSIEKKDLPLENYMSIKQTDINEKMRVILINWIIEVHFKFHLLSETLFICINIIDRYLSKKNINRKNLQLLGVTSLFIACKYEEIYAPTSKDLIFMTDNAYKTEEMIQMESDILNIIEFDLTFPTSLRFLEIFKNYLELDEINFYRCCYLNEISLINYSLCSFNPSLIACVCLYLNLKSNILYFKGYNEEQLFSLTGYKKVDIKNCLNKLISAVMKIEDKDNKFIAVKKKYALDKYMKVSTDCYLIKEEKE
jgi:cyclin B